MFYRKALANLNEWKESPRRKPLIIRGARQVGKTTLVHSFSKTYKQYLYINLEKSQHKTLFTEYTDVHKLIERLFFVEDMEISLLHETLLFIDELQEVSKAVNLLRYFKEDLPELHVIAAGSMLETLLGKNITFPVGRVEYMMLRPVSFIEFLEAIGEKSALEQLHIVPLNSFAKDKILNLFHTYALLGGMPEVVQTYAETRDITSLKPIYFTLLNAYHEDAEKYAKSSEQLQLIRFLLDQVLFEAGKRITFQNFGKSNYKSKDVGEVLRTLQKTDLLSLLYPCVGYSIPLEKDFRKAPRLHYLDTGLMNFKVGLQKEIIGTKDLCSVYQGKMIEHLVGQEILSEYFSPLEGLNFWVRDKNSSSAELDFVYPFEGKLVPIEVKSGPKGTIKSLALFMDQSSLNFAIRFYAGELKLDRIQTPKGKTFYLLNLPYFLACKTEKYISWLLETSLEDQFAHLVGEIDEGDSLQEPMGVYQKVKKQEQIASTLKELTKEHFKVLAFCQYEPKTSKSIIEDCLGLSFQTRNKRFYIKPLLRLELLEWTDKENPKSRKQAYQITKLGTALLK